MKTYKTKIEVPEEVHNFFNTLTGYGAVEYRPGDSTATFTVKAPGGYDLALTVREIEEEFVSYFAQRIEVPRPEEVTSELEDSTSST